MYLEHFALREAPFSIAPNPRFVWLSERHQDALAHLLVGLNSGAGGGFVALTGVVGSGKTTLCRLLLKDLPADVELALILNPALEPLELQLEILRELKVDVPPTGSSGSMMHVLNTHLLARHAAGKRVVVLIDEAQALPRASLEQLRLMTNLETDEHKLIQIVLVGQPELRELLADPALANLDQRITARFHLDALTLAETRAYISHRLSVAGATQPLFSQSAISRIHRAAGGIPRLINAIAERALLAAYARSQPRVDARLAGAAADEVRGIERKSSRALFALAAVVLIVAGVAWLLRSQAPEVPVSEPINVPNVAPTVALVDPFADLSSTAAFAEIARLWGESDPSSFAFAQLLALEGSTGACDSGHSAALRCISRSGSFAVIRALGRPVVLKRLDRYVLLLGFDETSALIYASDAPRRVPLEQLLAGFAGEYVAVYSSPRQPSRAWITARLNDWSGAPGEFRRLDQVKASVVKFQRAHGLEDDGVVGELSALLLSSYHPIGPKLLELKPIASPRTDVPASGRLKKI